jgi:hypothetical protein
MLPWLQRDYVNRAFPGYAPLTDHEDDLPYDVDHVCPRNDWRNFGAVVSPHLQSAMRHNRDGVGESIGNLRLVSYSVNRHDQDTDMSEKMSCLVTSGEPDGACKQALNDWAFPAEDEHRALWRMASSPEPVVWKRKWSDDRLSAFQRAVERRTVWLYRRFHDDLGYAAWTSAQRHDDVPE